MCLGELARALGLKMTAEFSPPPSSTGTSNSSLNGDHVPMSSMRRPLMSSTQQHQGDGLPKAFVASLRVLFDILDEDKDGFVPFEEIKERWQSDGGPSGLPANVIECLSKVAPKTGKLSFERFCSGLRLALANGRKGQSPDRGSPNRNDRQPKPTTATVRPNVVHPMRSFKSAPQLRDEKKRRSLSENDGKANFVYDDKVQTSKPGKKKQQRYSTGNYETYYARPVSDVASSDTSYEDHNIYKQHRRHQIDDHKGRNNDSNKGKINENRNKMYEDHHMDKIYEDRKKENIRRWKRKDLRRSRETL